MAPRPIHLLPGKTEKGKITGDSPRDVIVQSIVRLREEVLLPQRMRLARIVVAAHLQLAAAHDAAAPVPIRRNARRARARGGVRVGVLGRGCGERSAAEEFGAVGSVLGVLAGLLEGVELHAEFGELGAEVANALVGLLLLRRV